MLARKLKNFEKTTTYLNEIQCISESIETTYFINIEYIELRRSRIR
jgi:hypothetical protein